MFVGAVDKVQHWQRGANRNWVAVSHSFSNADRVKRTDPFGKKVGSRKPNVTDHGWLRRLPYRTREKMYSIQLSIVDVAVDRYRWSSDSQ